MTTDTGLIRRSVVAYRRNHGRYEAEHGEIFNAHEQDRLRSELERALGAVPRSGASPKALDLGCGTGNLTRHLLELGAEVVAADISPDFLDLIRNRYGASGRVETAVLNGRDLSNFTTATFDFIAAYSVLHHVPDYLGLLQDALRVLKPGGVLYLDHEVNRNFWVPSPELAAFRAEVIAVGARTRFWNPQTRRWQRFLVPANYGLRLRRMLSPRYHTEGDIHVWPDDQIEWDRIEATITSAGAKILRRHDYLIFREGYPEDIYRRFSHKCSDMTVLVARKP